MGYIFIKVLVAVARVSPQKTKSICIGDKAGRVLLLIRVPFLANTRFLVYHGGRFLATNINSQHKHYYFINMTDYIAIIGMRDALE